ncbi:hypothetical protein A0256_12740 [Mucilaginibacter sp. PAMC 26640]|nr:hypothetical protein A0256_12740 [Mucilaginibacter sp. PAMC 26640]
MKKPGLSFYAAISVAFFLSSCSKQYYAPGLYQNDVQLMMKPQSQDSVKRKIYLSGALVEQSGASGQGSSNSGMLNVYQSHTFKHFNLSYGALAYTGNYSRTITNSDDNSGTNSNNTDIHISKSFNGYGLNGSVSYYFSNEVCDFRILGADLIYTNESGDYLAFRKSVYGQPDVLSSPRGAMLTYGFFTEYVFHQRKDPSFGFKIFANKVTGQINRDLNDYGTGFNTVGGSLFAEFHHINLHCTFVSSFTNYALGAGFQLGAGYSF